MEPVQLDRYIEYVGEASKRSRWLLLLLTIASVFGLSSFLTARKGAWSWDRLAVLNDVVDCQRAMAKCSTEQVDNSAAFLARWEYLTPAEYSAVITTHDLSKAHVDLEALKHHVEHQRQVIMDRVAMQTAPFLGFTFDVNDLGIVATVTFLSLLAVFMLALRREAQNLAILREYALRTGCLRQARELIAMRQVFTIVFRNAAEPKRTFRRVVLENIETGLLAAPLVVLALITWMDLSTMDIGAALNSSEMLRLCIIEITGIVAAVFLASRCFAEQRGLRAEFRAQEWMRDPGAETKVVTPGQAPQLA